MRMMMMFADKTRSFMLLFLLWTMTMATVALASDTTEQTRSADGECTATTTTTNASNNNNNKDCKDQHKNCAFWANLDECEKNPGFMKVQCRVSCKTCNDDFIAIPGSTTSSTTSTTSTSDVDGVKAGSDFGIAQRIYNAVEFSITAEQIQRRIQESREYLEQEAASQTLKKDLLDMCRNDNADCTLWALMGECEANPTYMKKNCAPACQTCEYLSIESRCPIDPDAPEIWGPGDLDKTFVRLTTQEPYVSDYDVKILSSPSNDNGGGPWVIQLENVVSEQEAERLIELGALEGYKLSQNVGKLLPNGENERVNSTTRTSMNAWCNDDCYKDELAQAVIYRLSNLTGIPETNSEYIQLLRYEEGQFYKTHHDYIDTHNRRQQGVRILTFYLYLNDVEAGGGTNFDRLGVTVMPKRGRAVLWPSVFDDKPHEKDIRTTHQALAVEKGIKYGANAWFHIRDFKTPHKNGCQ